MEDFFTVEILEKFNKNELRNMIVKQGQKLERFLVRDEDTMMDYREADEEEFKDILEKLVKETNTKSDAKTRLIELLQHYSRFLSHDKTGATDLFRKIEGKVNELVTKKTISAEESASLKANIDDIARSMRELGTKKVFFKVDRNIVPFYGNQNEKIDDWLYVVESWRKLHSVPNERMLPLLTPLFRGNALQVLKSFQTIHGEEARWVDFSKNLRAMYDTESRKRHLRQELRNLKYTGGNFAEFTHKFQYQVAQVEIPDREAVDLFIDALMPKTKLHILERKPANLAEAIVEASRYEDCCGSGQKSPNQSNLIRKVHYAKANFPRNPRQSNFNNKQVAFDRSKPKPWQKSFNNNNGTKYPNQRNGGFAKQPHQAADKAQVKCYNCQRMGHMSKDCRAPKRMVHKANIVTEDTRAEQRGRREELVFQTSTEEHCILGTEAVIDGHAVKASFDSGATASIISHEVTRKYSIKVLPSAIKVKTADNSINNVIGITEPLTIEVHGHICKLEMLVMDHEDHDVLLGLNWFVATGAGLFPAEKVLKFPGQKVHLDTDGKWIQDERYLSTIDPYDEVLISEIVDSDDLSEETNWEPLTKEELDNLKIKPTAELTKEQLSKFNAAIKGLTPMFAVAVADLESCNIGKHTIRTMDVEPIYSPPYRKSQAEREILKAEVNMMLQNDIIEQSKSEWSSPCLLVPKKDGTKRFCVDYRKLNAVTHTEQWPIPRIQDILDRLAGSIWFTAWDLTSGYWQIEMEPASKAKTAFSTPDGHYQFKRMPFGLKNAPADFSRIMHRILGNRDYVEIYLDDITIHSKTFEEHLEHIRLVSKDIMAAHLKVKPNKCTWLAKQIAILGHIVSGGQVSMDPKKVEALRKRLPPRNVKHIQQFLGICNYYRKFVRGYADIAAPLFNLLKSDVNFEWQEQHQNAFDRLIAALTSYPVLRQPDLTQPFIVHTDASGFALGAVLSQKDDSCEYACAFASRILKGAEVHYGITEKECLAVIFAIKQFRIYLYGTRFQIVTDHSALAWLMNINDPTGRLARWAIYLQAYEFEIVHRKGIIHSNADTLSRPVLIITRAMTSNQEEDTSTKSLDPYEDDTLIYYLKYKKNASGLSKKQVKRIEKLIDHYSIDDMEQIWYRKSTTDVFKKVPKPSERRDITTRAHLLGHFQVESTLSRLKEEYYWRNMIKDVELVVSQCVECRKEHRVVPMEHPAKALEVSGIFDRVGIDLTFGLPTTNEGYNGLLVITEYLSKYPYAVPIKSKTADEIAEKLLVYISLFGPPKTILSDQGTEFNNSVVAKLVKATGVERRITSAYHPRTNGQTERFNYTFIEALRKYTSEDNENWPKWVPFFLMAFRTRVHSTTGFTPFELMFGRKMNTFSDWRSNGESNATLELENRAREIQQLVEHDHASARDNIGKSQEAQRKSQNTQHRVTLDVLPIGTKVYVSTTGMHDKLYPKYRGPYTVVEHTPGGNYIVENRLKERLSDSLPLQRLKVIKEGASTAAIQPSQPLFVRVEHIVKAKQEANGDYLYLVKYHGYPESENEWISKNDFTDIDMINNFWKVEKGLKEKKKPGRPRKIQPVNLIYSCILLFFFIQAITGIKIEDDFYFCTGSHETLWSTPFVDIESGCKEPVTSKAGSSKWLSRNAVYSSTYVLTKAVHTVNRLGWECHKWIQEITGKENLFGAKETVINETMIELTPAACWRMVEEKTCEGVSMTCDAITCSKIADMSIEHSWMTTTRRTDFSCVVSKKNVIAKNVNSNLFGQNCTAKDLFCKTKQSIIVWPDGKDECSLRRTNVGTKFNHTDRDILVQTETNIALAITNKTKECDMDVYTTKEGLFVSFSLAASKLALAEDVNIAALHELMLAEADGEKFETAKHYRNTQNQLCQNFATFLREMRKEDNRYDIFIGVDGKTRVLYSKNGLIFLPKCIKINMINIDVNTTQCYEDILINFEQEKNILSGFLLENNVIVTKSKQIACKDKVIYKNFPKNNTVVIRNKSGGIEMKTDIHKVSLASIQEVFYEVNFPHNKGIFQTVDIINEILSLNLAVNSEEEK